MKFNIKKIAPQLLTLLFVILVFGFFSYNAQLNMENRGIDFGYGFLSQESSFDVQFSLIEYDGSHSYFRAYLVGLLNTILVSVIGIILATIIGVIVGIARLSSNYLIKNTAAFYVEFFRNIPLLLQIFFWYFAALRALPLPQDTESIMGVFYLTIKGLFIPAFIWENFNIFLYSIIAAVVSIVVIKNYAKRKRENEGKQIPVFLISIGLLFILPLLSFLIGGVSLSFEIPVLKKLAKTSYIYEGGVGIPPELIALTLALSNQYLNLTKNSSLAAAIAYPDLVLVFAGTALMQTGKAIEIVSITMLTYLSLSLSISVLMNWYNKKIAIKEK